MHGIATYRGFTAIAWQPATSVEISSSTTTVNRRRVLLLQETPWEAELAVVVLLPPRLTVQSARPMLEPLPKLNPLWLVEHCLCDFSRWFRLHHIHPIATTTNLCLSWPLQPHLQPPIHLFPWLQQLIWIVVMSPPPQPPTPLPLLLPLPHPRTYQCSTLSTRCPPPPLPPPRTTAL